MAQAKRITVTLDEDTYERVRQVAQARRVSASEILRECAQEQLHTRDITDLDEKGVAELREWLEDFSERITASGRIISGSENIPREELYDRGRPS